VCYNIYPRGAVAQLVEHCVRIAGVRGSNPLSSTIMVIDQNMVGIVPPEYRFRDISSGCHSTTLNTYLLAM
jgi:hypothetical protein